LSEKLPLQKKGGLTLKKISPPWDGIKNKKFVFRFCSTDHSPLPP
jgi:hypothetical protein